ncbi:myosin-4-like [Dorcoceras hygrometricum]|uniref:Myosin-4-like n=1 Tax=Dorcoceras hygrometricum TaxID=472368 RepID=A0A2Z7BM40_9LAMI|nr:myosin-4-like [Dorcoceras hygrometricum]
MSLFDLQDVCIAIGSISTLDLPMVVDLIGIYGLKGPYSGPVVDLDTVPTGIFHAFQHRLAVEGFCDFFVQPVVQYISSSSSSESAVSIRPRSPDAIPSGSSSSASLIYFTEDIPQTSMPTVFVPSAEFTESFAQLRASVDQIQLEQVRTRDDVAELKAALSSKITDLEAAFAHASTYQERVFRNKIYDVQQEINTQNAALSRDLDDFRKETQEGITTLSAQLSEIIAYINWGRDNEKGQIESSSGLPPDSRPGSGSSRPGEGGSRS